MFGQSLLSAFGIACTTDTDQLFPSTVQATSVATYQLNNATTSIPSNTYPGTASNITYAAGKFGNAAVFNGSSSKITATSPTQGNTDASYSFWIKIDTVDDSKQVFGQVSDSARNPFTIQWHNSTAANKMTFGMWRCFSNQIWYQTGYLSDFDFDYVANTWYHIVMTYTASDKSVRNYVNGTQIGGAPTLSLLASGITTGTQMVLGSYNSLPSEFLDGSIDQVRIFNTALPQSAITALYNETTTTAQSASVDYQAANPNSIAYYKMSDATDQLGNYNGTATNVNFNTEGKFGFAGAFNNGSGATSSYISLPSFMPTGNNPRSISMWIKTTSTSYQELFSYGSGGNNNFFIFRLPAGGTKLGIAFYANDHDFTATNITDGNWHHCAATYDGNLAKVYYDGVLIGTGTAGSISTNASNEKISGYQYTGSIDQVRIYDAVLSAANVSTLYKEVECEPAAINALDQFNTVLYTGNGGTQAITGVGFKPGFSWVKNRNTNGNSHELADTIRGVDNTLNTNTSSAQYNNSTYQFNSFDTDGITVTDDAAGNYAVNGNNETYVSWNWKAPLANLSTSFNGSSSQITLLDSLGTAMGNNNFSVSFWVNVNSASHDEIYLSITRPYDFYVRKFSSGSIYLNLGTLSYDTGVSLSTGWHHIAVTKSSSSGSILYLDNNATADASKTGNITGNNIDNSIGDYNNGSYIVDGEMGQVRIFDDVLTASEVADLYTEPAASNNTLNYPAGAGCIAAYPLQTDAVDLSGNYSGASSNVTFGQPGYLTSNTDGTIPSTVAVNDAAGFSIVKYTGNGNNSTIGHGLSSAPDLIITKGIDSVVGNTNWLVYNSILGATKRLILNSSNASATASTAYNDTEPTSSVFTIGTTGDINGNGAAYIAYCFTSIPGYSKIGSYNGTGASGNTIYIGFEPSFLIIKSTGVESWYVMDNKRLNGIYSDQLYANLTNAEGTGQHVDFITDGFKLDTTDGGVNNGSATYIFLAIA